MTEIEQKALALLNEVRKGANPESEVTFVCRDLYDHEALCRALEQHEAFRQEVSDAVTTWWLNPPILFQQFIIPAPKPDPLVAVLHEVDTGPEWDSPEDYCNKIRAALDALGFEIREKGE